MPEIQWLNPVGLDELREIYVLRDVDLDKLYGLLRTCPVRRLKAEEVLIAPGEPSSIVYVLLAGQLRVHLNCPKSEPLSLLSPGETIGEIGVLDHLPRTLLVVADSPSRVLQLSTSAFWSMVYHSHEFTINLLTIQSQRLRDNATTLEQIVKVKETYQRHAIMDGLTGLYNRRWLAQMLPRFVQRSQRDGMPLVLAMVDIDFFKQFNDTYGHQAGDHVLFQVGQRLLSLFRPQDHLIRYGGEEFTIVLVDTVEALAYEAMERAREVIAGTAFKLAQGTEVTVTVSIGLAELAPNMCQDELIFAADQALYRAKKNGRNRCERASQA